MNKHVIIPELGLDVARGPDDTAVCIQIGSRRWKYRSATKDPKHGVRNRAAAGGFRLEIGFTAAGSRSSCRSNPMLLAPRPCERMALMPYRNRPLPARCEKCKTHPPRRRNSSCQTVQAPANNRPLPLPLLR
jgi:hypothetical protein